MNLASAGKSGCQRQRGLQHVLSALLRSKVLKQLQIPSVHLYHITKGGDQSIWMKIGAGTAGWSSWQRMLPGLHDGSGQDDHGLTPMP
eukprot:s2164_g7.t2